MLSGMLFFGHWPFVINCASSVSLVFLNKHLLNECSFRFLGFLAALHTGTTYFVASRHAIQSPVHKVTISKTEVLLYLFLVLAALISMNLSLMLNSVGVYQISKIAMIPACCLLEFCIQRKRIKFEAFAAIVLLMTGVVVACVPSCAVELLLFNFHCFNFHCSQDGFRSFVFLLRFLGSYRGCIDVFW